MNDLEKQIEADDTGNDLASVNILMQKQQVTDTSVIYQYWLYNLNEVIFKILTEI